MNYWSGFAPSPAPIASVPPDRILPNRECLSKEGYSKLLREEFGVLPGTPAYMQKASEFMPLEVEIGRAIETNEMVCWYPLNEMNPSISISGVSGGGKTEAVKKIVSQLLLHGMPTLLVDFHGDIKVPHMKDILISSGTASVYGLNPLSIEFLNPEKRGLYEHRSGLISMLKRAVPALSAKQRFILSNAVETAYVAVGIEDCSPRTWSLPPPTFAHVSSILESWMRDPSFKSYRDSIGGCLASLGAVFGHPVFSRSFNISVTSILSGAVRLDLSQLDERIQVIFAETVLRMVFYALQAMGPSAPAASTAAERVRLFVVIDETKILSMGNGDPDKRSNMLNVIGTEGRKFGMAGCFASQSTDHFGADLRRNIATRLALRCMDEGEAKRLSAEMRVPPADLRALSRPGEGYFCPGSAYAPQHVQVDPLGEA